MDPDSDQGDLSVPGENPYDRLSEHGQMFAPGMTAAGAGKGPTGAFRTWRRWFRGLPNPIDDVDRLAGKRFTELLRRRQSREHRKNR
jgi:hypothetical protein